MQHGRPYKFLLFVENTSSGITASPRFAKVCKSVAVRGIRADALTLAAIALTAGMLLPAVMPAQAATKSWTGTTSSDWSTGTNWSAAGAPGAADTANINLFAGPTVSSAAQASAVNVGNTATGSLTISGATLSDSTGIIGVSSGISGTTTVSGAGSSWANAGTLTVGSSGGGTLNVQSGGAVSNTTGTLASAVGSTGAATVSGTGST